MAATVSGSPITNGVFPDRHANLGPFKVSTGYAFMSRSSANSGQIAPQTAADPMTGFGTATLKTMSSGTTTAIQAAACYQVGDVIHIVTQISTGACYYNNYDPTTDTWGLSTSELAVAAASQPPTTNATFVDLVVRSGGEVVIIHCAGQTAMSSTFNMVRHRRRTGVNTYQTAVNVDNGGSVNWTSGYALLGDSDRVHFFLKDVTNADFYQRTLTAANALQTWPAAFEAAASAAYIHTIGAGTSFVSGANTVAAAAYYCTSSSIARLARLTSGDAPSVSVEQVADPTTLGGANGQVALGLAADGATLHYLYSDTVNDLWRDTDGGTSTWGTDTEELDLVNVTHITTKVYDRSGTKLAMVIDDGGTIKYAEITLVAGPAPTSFIWPTETPYRILSRR